MRWMTLELVIPSEVSQKEKNKYSILMHTYDIQKNGTGEPICRAGIQMQAEKTVLWTQQGKERGWDKQQHGSIYITIYKTDSQWEFAI